MKRLTYLVLALVASTASYAQGDPDTVAKLVEEGKGHNQARLHLETICEQFGSRLTSSSYLEGAQAWAMEQFKAFGCQNVHLEKWGEWPVGFDRDRSGQVGRMTAPIRRNFQFTTPSWTPGTKGLQKGQAVMEPKSMDELNKNKSKFKGAWMVMMPRAGEGIPTREVRDAVMEAARKAGIKGTVQGSANELVITSGNYNITWDKLPKDVRITVRKSDYTAITDALNANKKVDLEFDVRQQFRKGPIVINNVVAEIPGTEKPDEVVIVSGHFDSWDGPMSQGALDNGTGSCVTLECARILGTVMAKPKRTIRFILWSGEEQGLFGSRQYVKDHAAEMDKISAVLVDDGGTNYWGGFVGLETQIPFFQKSMDTLNEAFPTLPMKWRVSARMPRGGGSDHASFNAVGVPGFFTEETGVSDYNYVHHTQHDRLEAAINAYLVQSSTAAAVTSYNLACADQMLPREPKAGG
ncbi:MAG: M28 family peptidase [Armatimonadetes bacterium]|nr:M28 family peptidase [Armatimonadota bacterium]